MPRCLPRPAQATLVVAALALAACSAAQSTAPPRCFGAAARDPVHRCSNARLRHTVTPSLSAAPMEPNAPCTPVASRRPPRVCSFGLPVSRARDSIAVLGDSHAAAWRAAVAVAARAERWHGFTIRRNGCPFTLAIRDLPEPDRGNCGRYFHDALDWLGDHPEVHVVFVTASAFAGVVAPDGTDPYAAAVAGARDAIAALPASVRRVVVLRDSPRAAVDTLACVRSAIMRHQLAGPRCALARGAALPPDPEVDAASQLAPSRGGVIDLSSFFCDATLCYPVVGGALVYKDVSHITATFGASLGPYLLGRYRAL